MIPNIITQLGSLLRSTSHLQMVTGRKHRNLIVQMCWDVLHFQPCISAVSCFNIKHLLIVWQSTLDSKPEIRQHLKQSCYKTCILLLVFKMLSMFSSSFQREVPCYHLLRLKPAQQVLLVVKAESSAFPSRKNLTCQVIFLLYGKHCLN